MKRRKPLFISLCAVLGTLLVISFIALVLVAAIMGSEIGSGEYYDNPDNYEQKECVIDSIVSDSYSDNTLYLHLKTKDDRFSVHTFIISGESYRIIKKTDLLEIIEEETDITVWIVQDYLGTGWYGFPAGISYGGVEYLPFEKGYKIIANAHYETEKSAKVAIPIVAVIFVFILLHFIANFIIYFKIAKPVKKDDKSNKNDLTTQNTVENLIGNTPLVRLNKTESMNGSKARLFAKLESYNPAGSVKDRIALAMIVDAEKRGLLTPGSTIVEPTSGNTGIALAMISAVRGYRLILTMPETMSVERQQLLKAYGAEIVLTEGKKGMKGAIERAENLKAELGAFMPNQFNNEANPKAHFTYTGPEIWRDTAGQVDILVAGVGTGGTISGVGKYLKSQKSNVRVVAVEPKNSPMLSEGKSGPHGIQGIGAGFVPATLDKSVCDEIVTVTEEQAYKAARLIAKTEGILMGISGGAAAYCATELSMKEENAGKNIVVILPDGGEKYLSTSLFSEELTK